MLTHLDPVLKIPVFVMFTEFIRGVSPVRVKQIRKLGRHVNIVIDNWLTRQGKLIISFDIFFFLQRRTLF